MRFSLGVNEQHNRDQQISGWIKTKVEWNQLLSQKNYLVKIVNLSKQISQLRQVAMSQVPSMGTQEVAFLLISKPN